MRILPVALLVALASSAVGLGLLARRAEQARMPSGSQKEDPVATTAVAKQDRSQEVEQLPDAQASLWSMLQTDDLALMVRRLREAGFPPSIVQAVLNAQIADRFSPRYKAAKEEAEKAPYWNYRLSRAASSVQYRKWQELDRERTGLMKQLLGDDYRSPTDGRFSEMHYGSLPKEKRDYVERLEYDSIEMNSSAVSMITLPEDRTKREILEKEKHAELAALLSPEELKEYEFHNSNTALQLVETMYLMDATEEEYRTIFLLRQKYDAQWMSMKGNDMETKGLKAREQYEAEVKAVLGETRAAEFARAEDRDFSEMVLATTMENLPRSVAVQAYDMRASAMDESYRIYSDTTLTVSQKREAMQALAQTTTAKLTATLGSKGMTSYQRSAWWLEEISKGTCYRKEGVSMKSYSLPTSQTKL